MTTVIPAILPESLDDLAEHVARVKGLVSRVQVDVANGSYAPSRTWPYVNNEGFAELVSQDAGLPMWEDVEYEVDFLIKKPEAVFADWIKTGIVGAVVHIESTDEHAAIMDMAQNAGIDLGWGIKPSTPNSTLFELIEALGMPDFVQIMGNDTIGYHGVELDESVYDKIVEIHERYPDLTIAVDIGINDETAPTLVDAGATKLVSGSFIFDSGDIAEVVQILSE